MEFIADILFKMAPDVHIIAFGLLLLAGFNLPVSEDIVFIVSASIAATIIPQNKYLIFFGCFAGAYFSDIISYSIGKYAGRRILQINFFKRMVPDEKIKKTENYFIKYGGKTLFFGRFIPFGVRNVLFITSGIVGMRFIKFLIVDIMALCITSTILFTLGYSFGKNYKQLIPYLDKYKFIIFGIFLCVLMIFFMRNKFKKSPQS